MSQIKRHVTISIDSEVHAAAVERAKLEGMDFSELVTRLSVAELRSKRGIARRFPRKLKQEAAR